MCGCARARVCVCERARACVYVCCYQYTRSYLAQLFSVVQLKILRGFGGSHAQSVCAIAPNVHARTQAGSTRERAHIHSYSLRTPVRPGISQNINISKSGRTHSNTGTITHYTLLLITPPLQSSIEHNTTCLYYTHNFNLSWATYQNQIS
jgi:hypothetical protein